MKKLYSVSLIIIGVLSIVNSVCAIFGLKLPDIAVRINGIVGIIAAAVLVFACVRLYITNKENKE